MELSTNQIWNPNLIVDFGLIRNPKTDSSRQLWFWSNFNRLQLNFDLFWIKDQFRDRKSQLNDQKIQFKDRKSGLNYWKSRFIQKTSIYISKFDLYWKIRSIFDINWLFRSYSRRNSYRRKKFDWFRRQFWIQKVD